MRAALLIIRRFAAFAIDWLLFGVVSLPIVLVFWLRGVDKTAEARFQTILLWAWLIYFVVFEWLYGATIGKFIFRLTVSTTNETRLSLLSAVSRAGLTLVIPSVVSVFIIPGILFLNSSNFAEHMAIALSTAILAAIPLSIIIFKGQSIVDVVLHTCVTPVTALTKTTLAVGARRWILVGLLSLFVGIAFSWMVGFSYRMMYGADDINEAGRTLVNTFPPDLMGGNELAPSDERKIMLDMRGNFIRQPKLEKTDLLGKSFQISLYGSSTSFDELLIMRRMASYMAELPDEERPKCIRVKFTKEFDTVFAGFQQHHEMTVCDVPKGLPYQATLIDHNLSGSWQFKVNAVNILSLLVGQSDSDINRVAPPNRK